VKEMAPLVNGRGASSFDSRKTVQTLKIVEMMRTLTNKQKQAKTLKGAGKGIAEGEGQGW